MAERFTIDGDPLLERRLGALCEDVLQGVRRVVSQSRLRALVLGGGYGRGQGGVLRSTKGDQPYNDLEFYVFLDGNRLWNDRRFRARLESLARELSPGALHVEFKIESLERLRLAPISMFSYDLVAAHRVLCGGTGLFNGCEHHLKPETLPVSEATRLLFNRCTGLLLAKELLLLPGGPNSENADFIGRNIAKAQLALGDAFLAAKGQYCWDVRERHRRLRDFPGGAGFEFLAALKEHHAAGVEFKLHPNRSEGNLEDLREKHKVIALLARDLWLWLESRRLNRTFATTGDYSAGLIANWDHSPGWVNYLLNLRTFGMKAALDPKAARYPRERLLTALPVLLWEQSELPAKQLQFLLHARAPDWKNLVAAYKEVWPAYG